MKGGPSAEQRAISKQLDRARSLIVDALRLCRRGGSGAAQQSYKSTMKAHREVCGALNLFEGGDADAEWTPFQESHLGGGDKARLIKSAHGYVGTFINSRYQVQVMEYDGGLGPCTWLMIVRRDRRALHDWRDFQRIKNELCGAEHEAVELYPAESRLVDTNNQYHLFVFPPEMRFPIGFRERDVGDAVDGTAHRQRPFDVVPEDLNARGGGDARMGAQSHIDVFGPPIEDESETERS